MRHRGRHFPAAVEYRLRRENILRVVQLQGAVITSQHLCDIGEPESMLTARGFGSAVACAVTQQRAGVAVVGICQEKL